MKHKKSCSTLFISLLALSVLAFAIPSGPTQSQFALTVEAAVEDTITSYERSVRIHPDEQDLQFIPVSVYLTDWCKDGGVMMETPAFYFELMESTNYEIKVPFFTVKGQWRVLFEHWEVWEQDGTPELDWIAGVNETHVYTGSWEQNGVTYTRITKLIATPKNPRYFMRPQVHTLGAIYQTAEKELLDRSDGIQEPYLRFGIHNPVGGGDKKLIAVYHLQWGPESELLTFKLIRDLDHVLLDFLLRWHDVTTDFTRWSDLDELDEYTNACITSSPGLHMSYIGSNLRLPWMGPQDGGEPGASLRKALAYMRPEEQIRQAFRFITYLLNTSVPLLLEEWCNQNVPVYSYNATIAYDTLTAGGWRYDAGLGTWYHDTDSNDTYDEGEPVAGGADRVIQVLSPTEVDAPTSFTIVGRYVDELNALVNPATGDPTPIAAEQYPIVLQDMMLRVFCYHDFEQYFGEWNDRDIGLNPDFLYRFFHSANDRVWGDNAPGIQNPDLDDQLEIMMFSLNHDTQVTAAMEAQLLLSDMLPYIPIYSRNYFNAHQPEFYGVTVSTGFGIENFWTLTSIKGPRESFLYTPPLTQIQGNETIWRLGDSMACFNPAEARSIRAWTVLETMYDGLIGTNPHTLLDIPWLAKAWNIVYVDGPMTTPHGVEMVDGMYVEFILDDRVVEGKVRWHDGEVFNADDIMFSWQYAWDNSLTNHYAFHERLVDIDNPSPDRVVAYWDRQSQWLPYDAADTAALYAPQVWGYIDTDFDGQTYTGHGDVEGDWAIRTYQPQHHPRSDLGAYPAQLAFPWLSQAIGTGPFVLYEFHEAVEEIRLFAFDTRSHTTVVPSVHYWKSRAEITERKVEMFYHVGDVTLDAGVNVLDLAHMGITIFQSGPTYPSGDYRGFIQWDVNEDGVINTLDLSTAGVHFGWEEY